jgi:hypothetical protein
MRQSHGTKWNRMPSNALNTQFRSQLNDYSMKAQQAGSTDDQIKIKYEQN